MATPSKSKRRRKKYTGQGLKDYRHNLAILKKAGIVSKKTDARSQKVTRHYVRKINQYRGVLEGREIAVKAKPEIREKYKDVFKTINSHVLVPKEFPNQTAKVRRPKGGGSELIVKSHPPREVGVIGQPGEKRRTRGWEEVMLPFQPQTMPQLVEGIREHPEMEGWLGGDEMWGFQLYGHSSRKGFPDLDETQDGMRDYINTKYRHLFDPRYTEQAVSHFHLIKYWPPTGEPPPTPLDMRIYNNNKPLHRPKRRSRYRPEGREQSSWEAFMDNVPREKDKSRKRALRASETAEQKAARLAKHQAYKKRKRSEKKDG